MKRREKYHLTDKITTGYWKGQVIQDLIDKIPKTFIQHVNNYPYLYDKDVTDYLAEVEKDMNWLQYTEFESVQEYKRILLMPNT